MPTRSAVRQATPGDLHAIRDLCRAYRELLVARNPDTPEIVEAYYEAAAYETLLTRLPDLHARPHGAIFAGVLDGAVQACGMTHRIDANTCEIKRVYVSDTARGQGLGRWIFEAAMTQARADGYARMVLDTMRVLPEAIALYKTLDFTEAAPFYDLDRRFADQILFFERNL